MGLPSVSDGIGYLTKAGIRAGRGYPGRLMPHISSAVVAVSLKRQEPKKKTLSAAVCGPQWLGAVACEYLAEKVSEAWTAAGAVCTYGQCRFDGQSALYILEVQGSWEV